MNEKGFRILEQLDRIAEAHGVTVAQVALAWIMGRPGITAAIASATSVEQVRELRGAIDLQLKSEEMEALNRVSA
jgi:aryl-alcohol dehydrogenase-like predicted oxidoreductase